MTRSLILVKDNINNTYSIYDNNDDNGFKNCIDFLQKKTSLVFKHVIVGALEIQNASSQQGDICELFCEKQTTNKGWVWNTDITDTIKMYTLSFILYENKNETNDNSTQTEIQTKNVEIQATPLPIITKNTSTSTVSISEKLSYSPINYFKYEIDEESILSNCLYSYSNENLQNKYCFNNKIKNDKIKTECKTEYKIKTDKIKEPASSNVSHENSLNDHLILELKQNLKMNNYGLRRRRKIYKNVE